MTAEHFFELLLLELKERPEMHSYYKFLGDKKSFAFRKNYFLQRLKYIEKHIHNPAARIWDCGSGYGTTCLFLAMNGIAAHGTTLEFYFETVQKRYAFWNQYGNANLFTCSYENLFDSPPPAASYDIIIVQDTLHHLEPIHDALSIFQNTLKENGKIIAIEENGNNVIQNIKLYKYRGNKRIISMYDEKLQKDILIGNENIRSFDHWHQLFSQHHFYIPNEHVNYVRYYLPQFYKGNNGDALLKKEQVLQAKSKFRKKYFFFGLNFIATKNK